MSVAATVMAAIQQAQEWRPDVMLLDATLGDGDGLAVLDSLASSGDSPPNTLAMTGHDDDDIRQLYIDAGCVDVLLKPVPIARLLALVQSL